MVTCLGRANWNPVAFRGVFSPFLASLERNGRGSWERKTLPALCMPVLLAGLPLEWEPPALCALTPSTLRLAAWRTVGWRQAVLECLPSACCGGFTLLLPAENGQSEGRGRRDTCARTAQAGTEASGACLKAILCLLPRKRAALSCLPLPAPPRRLRQERASFCPRQP